VPPEIKLLDIKSEKVGPWAHFFGLNHINQKLLFKNLSDQIDFWDQAGWP
jgi:hypothetical protein